MKTRKFQMLPPIIVALTVLALVAGNAVAQNSPTSPTSSTAAAPAASQAVPRLSYGVPEVLQLSQAKVGDSTIIAYIQNSGNNYGLNAAQIIYLRQQGVSDAVINAMLNQRSQTAQTASTTATAPPDDSSTDSAQTSTATAPPTVTYVQTVPTSTVYVIPDTQTYQYNNWLYYNSPYYGCYPAYYYPYPAVSVSFGFGGGWGGYHGGWRGGWHGGGGWHH